MKYMCLCRCLNTSGETQKRGTLFLLELLLEFLLLLGHQLVKTHNLLLLCVKFRCFKLYNSMIIYAHTKSKQKIIICITRSLEVLNLMHWDLQKPSDILLLVC